METEKSAALKAGTRGGVRQTLCDLAGERVIEGSRVGGLEGG